MSPRRISEVPTTLRATANGPIGTSLVSSSASAGSYALVCCTLMPKFGATLSLSASCGRELNSRCQALPPACSGRRRETTNTVTGPLVVRIAWPMNAAVPLKRTTPWPLSALSTRVGKVVAARLSTVTSLPLPDLSSQRTTWFCPSSVIEAGSLPSSHNTSPSVTGPGILALTPALSSSQTNSKYRDLFMSRP